MVDFKIISKILIVSCILVSIPILSGCIESEPEIHEWQTSRNQYAGLRSGYDGKRVGQSFTIGTTGVNEDFYLTSIVLWVRRVSAGAGTVNVELYATNINGAPTGSVLSTGSFDDSDFGYSTPGECTVSMSEVILRKSTQYCFMLSNHDAGINDHTGIGQQMSDVYPGGAQLPAGYWDLYFKINGTALNIFGG